jgi:hypothetical protein
MKTERLKKLETEFKDLQQWMKLGLVPKSDLKKHEIEINSIAEKIEEEKDRMRFLKENGSLAEYVTPSRKGQNRSAYPENASISDINLGDNSSTGLTDAGLDMDTESLDVENSLLDSDEETTAEHTTVSDEDEDPFSDKNRWKRGIIDPDDDNW